MDEKYKIKSYFVPTEEDFYNGYIFEVKYDPEGWKQEVFGDMIWSVGQMHHMLVKKYKWEEVYRVKFLDKEDIESLGWQLHMRTPTFDYKEDGSLCYYFKKEKFFLRYFKEFDKDEVHVEIYEKIGDREESLIGLASNHMTIYDGNCPSINDLKYLEKLLKIKL